MLMETKVKLFWKSLPRQSLLLRRLMVKQTVTAESDLDPIRPMDVIDTEGVYFMCFLFCNNFRKGT